MKTSWLVACVVSSFLFLLGTCGLVGIHCGYFPMLLLHAQMKNNHAEWCPLSLQDPKMQMYQWYVLSGMKSRALADAHEVLTVQLKHAFFIAINKKSPVMADIVTQELLVSEQARLHEKMMRKIERAWNDFSIILFKRFVGPEPIKGSIQEIGDLIKEYALSTRIKQLEKVEEHLLHAQQAVIDGKYVKLTSALNGIIHPLCKKKTDIGTALHSAIDNLIKKLYLGRESLGRKAAENAYRVEAEREAIAEAVAKKVVEKSVIEQVVREAVAKEAALQAQEAREKQKAAEALRYRMLS